MRLQLGEIFPIWNKSTSLYNEIKAGSPHYGCAGPGRAVWGTHGSDHTRTGHLTATVTAMPDA